jgi:hypothetical protein
VVGNILYISKMREVSNVNYYYLVDGYGEVDGTYVDTFSENQGRTIYANANGKGDLLFYRDNGWTFGDPNNGFYHLTLIEYQGYLRSSTFTPLILRLKLTILEKLKIRLYAT